MNDTRKIFSIFMKTFFQKNWLNLLLVGSCFFPRCSLLFARYSFLSNRCSLLSACCFWLFVRCSLLFACCCLFFARYSLLCLLVVAFCSHLLNFFWLQFSRFSLVSVRCSLRSSHYLLRAAHCLLRFTRRWPMILSDFLLSKRTINYFFFFYIFKIKDTFPG